METKKLDLAQFTGTEHWYKHPLVQDVTYTDGAKYLAEQAQAYWLIDKIATSQMLKHLRKESFQAWSLTVDLDSHSAVLEASDGGKNGNAAKTIYREKISFTDFPLEQVRLWVSDNVILLPSEY